MSTLKKYDLTGQELGELSMDENFLAIEVHHQLVKDYIIAIRNNARQWSASTKGRSEVKCTNKKPHPQKGTGRARQGSLASPQFKGGGVVFGPKPKFNQHVRINRKERRQAIRFLLAEKITAGQVLVLHDDALDVPKTKVFANFVSTLKLKGRTLVLGESGNMDDTQTPSQKHANLSKSISNIQKVDFLLASNVSGYDLVRARNLVVTEQALGELQQWLMG